MACRILSLAAFLALLLLSPGLPQARADSSTEMEPTRGPAPPVVRSEAAAPQLSPSAVSPPQADSSSAQPAPASSQTTLPAPASVSPTIKLGTQQSAFEIGAEEKLLAWEQWHHRVGKALGKRIKHATGMMLGGAVIRITIYRDHELRADLLTSSSPAMGEACVSSARSLDRDPILEFPDQSKRDEVVFNFEYRRGFFVLPKSEYIKDDYEHLNND